MRKLVESTFVSLDGVISSPEVWGPPYWNYEHNAYAAHLTSSVDAMLLGRETYEAFAETWPQIPGDYAAQLNSLPKHIASRGKPEMTWNASLLEGDVAEAVRKLKQGPGNNILKFGTGELDRTLIEHKLVDEYHFWVFPVIVGSGQRLFDGLDTTHLHLADTVRFDSGIVVLVFNPK